MKRPGTLAALALVFAAIRCLGPDPALSGPTMPPAGTLLCGVMGCIYGADDRREPREVRSAQIRGWADSTAALFEARNVTENPETRQAALTTEPFTTAPIEHWSGTAPLCPDALFRGQNRGAFCSGALVGSDLIMTAGHCVDDEHQCKNGIKFVFGFQSGENGQPPAEIPIDDVYRCSQLLARRHGGGVDYALVKLDRPVRDRAPMRLRRTGKPPVGSPLTVIGHPLGLPAKISGGATIRIVSEKGYFAGNLDAYGGNSGSPVINTATGEVEGIAVRAFSTFLYDRTRGCATERVMRDDEPQGTEVTLVEKIKDLIPDHHKPKAPSLDALTLYPIQP
ncbi:MAG: trypsin-like peptidase domain-containing protein [Elusimicrobia bacterium]|nr:trypsin-like peptidase domain-containing protein [Elusimicrobiota bacterium]